jgi:hypothetical protein
MVKPKQVIIVTLYGVPYNVDNQRISGEMPRIAIRMSAEGIGK